MTCSFAEFPSRDQVPASTQKATGSGIDEPDTWGCKVRLSRAPGAARKPGSVGFSISLQLPSDTAPPRVEVSGRGSGTQRGGGLQGFLLWMVTSARLTGVPALYQLWAYPF